MPSKRVREVTVDVRPQVLSPERWSWSAPWVPISTLYAKVRTVLGYEETGNDHNGERCSCGCGRLIARGERVLEGPGGKVILALQQDFVRLLNNCGVAPPTPPWEKQGNRALAPASTSSH